MSELTFSMVPRLSGDRARRPPRPRGRVGGAAWHRETLERRALRRPRGRAGGGAARPNWLRGPRRTGERSARRHAPAPPSPPGGRPCCLRARRVATRRHHEPGERAAGPRAPRPAARRANDWNGDFNPRQVRGSDPTAELEALRQRLTAPGPRARARARGMGDKIVHAPDCPAKNSPSK